MFLSVLMCYKIISITTLNIILNNTTLNIKALYKVSLQCRDQLF